MQSLASSVAALQQQLGDSFPVDCVQAAVLAHAQQNPAHGHIDIQSLIQEGPKLGAQRKLSRALAIEGAKNVAAAIASMPDPVAREEEQARYSSLTCDGSLGSAYLHTPITARNAWFDGELFQLTACRQLGMEQHTEVCAACGLLRGGTVHARFCRAPGMAGQQTVVHHAVCRALRELVQESTGTQVEAESYAPFAGGDAADVSKHMDLLAQPGAFPHTAVSDPAYVKRLMVDFSHIEEQSGTHRHRASTDARVCCTEREHTKEKHYGGSVNTHSYTLATAAITSFGVTGAQFSSLIQAMANEHVARRGFVAEGTLMADAVRRFKSSTVARIRGRLSIALNAALSARVLKYKSTAFGGLAAGVQVEAAAAEVWELD